MTNRLVTLVLPSPSLQPDHLRGRGRGHLCHLRHVLRPGQFCPLLDPGEGHSGQAPPVCQRRQSPGLLDGQLPLGHGTLTWTCPRCDLDDSLVTLNVATENRCKDAISSCRWTTPSAQRWWCRSSSSSTRSASLRRPTSNRSSPSSCFMGRAFLHCM